MKKNRKRLMAYLLVFVMLFTLLPSGNLKAAELDSVGEDTIEETAKTEEDATEQQDVEKNDSEEVVKEESTTESVTELPETTEKEETVTELTETADMTSEESKEEQAASITTEGDVPGEESILLDSEETNNDTTMETIAFLSVEAEDDPTGKIYCDGSWGGGYYWYIHQGKAAQKKHYIFCLDHGSTMHSGTYTPSMYSGVIGTAENTFRISTAMHYFYKQDGWSSSKGYGDAQLAVWNLGGTEVSNHLITYAQNLWNLTELNSSRSGYTGVSPILSSQAATAYKLNKDSAGNSIITKKVKANNGSSYRVQDKTISVSGSAWKYFAAGAGGWGGISVVGCYGNDGAKLKNSNAKASVGTDGKITVSFNQGETYGTKDAPVTIVMKVDQDYSGATSIDYLFSGSGTQRMTYTTPVNSSAYFAIKVYATDATSQDTQIQIHKVDPAGRSVNGAVFNLRGNDEYGNDICNIDKESGDDGDGMVSFDIDTAGFYYLQETKSPDGMIGGSSQITFDVKEVWEGAVKKLVVENTATVAPFNPSVSYDAGTYTYTCLNDYQKGSAYLEKLGELLVRYENGEFIYEKRTLDKVTFDLYTSEDIYLNGELLWPADTLLTNSVLASSKWNEMGYEYSANITQTTDEDGKVYFNKLPLGHYYLVETGNAYNDISPGYGVFGLRIPFEITASNDPVPILTTDGLGKYINRSVPAHCIVYKVSADEKNDDEQADVAGGDLEYKPLAGAEFTLYANIENTNFDGVAFFDAEDTEPAVVNRTSSGKEIVEENTWIPLRTITTNGDGVADFDLELPYGKYMVVETYPPEGYSLAPGESYVFEHSYDSNDPYPNGAVFTHTFVDTKSAGVITVMKTGELLSKAAKVSTEYGDYAKLEYEQLAAENVQFELYDSAGRLVETLTTNEAGMAQSGKLDTGSYYIKEVSTNSSLILDNNMKKVDLKKNDLKQVVSQTVYFENQAVDTELKIYKTAELAELASVLPEDAGVTDSVYTYHTFKPEGVVFGLYTKEDITNYYGKVIVKAGSCVGYTTTDKNGIAKFSSRLCNGNYYYQEVKTLDETYVKDKNKYDFSITLAGEDLVKDLNKENPLLNQKYKGSIKVIKTDGDTELPLEGVRFRLYDEQLQSIGTFVTDVNGEISITKLPVGTYYLQETDTKEGYVLSGSMEKIDLTKSNLDQVLKIKNNKEYKGSIKVIKTDGDTEELLEGVEFTLFDSEKKEIGRFVTDENGEISVTGLAPGTYYLQETEALQEYILDDTMHKIDLTKSNLNQILRIKNKKKSGTSISIKTDTKISGYGHVKTGDVIFMIMNMMFMFAMAGLCLLAYSKRRYALVSYGEKSKKQGKKRFVRTMLLLLAFPVLFVPVNQAQARDLVIAHGIYNATGDIPGEIVCDGCVYLYETIDNVSGLYLVDIDSSFVRSFTLPDGIYVSIPEKTEISSDSTTTTYLKAPFTSDGAEDIPVCGIDSNYSYTAYYEKVKNGKSSSSSASFSRTRSVSRAVQIDVFSGIKLIDISKFEGFTINLYSVNNRFGSTSKHDFSNNSVNCVYGSQTEEKIKSIIGYSNETEKKSYGYVRGNVVYQLNGGTNHSRNASLGSEYGDYGKEGTYVLNADNIVYAPKRVDYEFDGWYTTPGFELNTDLKKNEDGNYILNSMEDVTLYAKWLYSADVTISGICYHINADKRATVQSGSYTGNVTIASSVTYKGKTYPVTGITEGAFANCNLESITIPSTVTSVPTGAFPSVKDVYIESMTLRLKDSFVKTANLHAYGESMAYLYYESDGYTGKKIPYSSTITYQLNGGTNDTSNPTVYMWKSLLTLQEAVKTGCRFDGWYTDSSFQPASRIARISEDEYEDIVLYAKFTPVTSTAVVNGETEVVNTPAAETSEEAVKNTVVEESNQTATDNIAELKTPEKAVIRSVENKKGNKIKVIIKRMADVTGYEIKYSTNKKFTKKTTKTLQTTKTTQTLKNLKKKTYYVKARAYQTDFAGNRTYGTWSKVKKVKVKK